MSIIQIFSAGTRWTALGAILVAGLNLLKILILTRYLEKTDFALVALSGIIISTGLMLQESGINAALVQRSTAGREDWPSLNGANLLTGVLLWLLALLAGLLFSLFYTLPPLTNLNALYALVFLLNGAGLTHRMLLQKQLLFKQLVTGELAGVAAGFVLSWWLAWRQAGAYALVGGWLAQFFVANLFFLITGKALFGWRISLNRQILSPYLSDAREFWLERLATHLVSSLDVLIFGKVLGPDFLGVYEVFKRVLVRPAVLLSSVLEKVLFPLFSRFQQAQMAVRSLFLQSVQVIAVLIIPLGTTLGFLAKTLIPVLFVSEWLIYTPIFSILSVFLVVNALLNPVDTLLGALGRIRLWRIANLWFLAPLAGILFFFSRLGMVWGVGSFVTAWAFFGILAYWLIVMPAIQVPAGKLIRSTLVPLLPAVTAGSIFILLPGQWWAVILFMFVYLVLIRVFIPSLFRAAIAIGGGRHLTP